MSEQPDPQRIQILIVEDDPMMRTGLKHLLCAQPQLEIVGMAEDGYLGVEAATTLQPDVVVMDVGMPHLDGIAATQQIKQTQPDVKVIMLTSHTDRTEVLAALSSGADGYCVKGTSVEQLVKATRSRKIGMGQWMCAPSPNETSFISLPRFLMAPIWM